jgi:hypothetical protein
MTAPTVVQSLAGAIISISAGLPTSYDAAGYAETDIVWTPIGQVENLGNHGGSKTITPFTPIDTAVVTKVGGSKDYGTMSLVLGNVAGDAGQILLKTAFEATNTHYSVKIVYADTGAVTPETHYLDVIVSRNENQDGAANDVRKLAVDFAICRKPIVVDPT